MWIAAWLVVGLALACLSNWSAGAVPDSRRWTGFLTIIALWPVALVGHAVAFAQRETPRQGGSGRFAHLMRGVPGALRSLSGADVLRTFRGEGFEVSTETMWKIFWVAAGSFIPLLFLQYVGEEPFYIIFAQEMWSNKQFLTTTLYSGNFGRPGIYSWLILILSGVLGQENMLVAARLITAAATLSMGLTLGWLVQRLFRDRFFAAFAAATFLSGDLLLYRGWLAYADPLFSCFVFGAIACLWVATEERRRGLLLLAVLALMGAFLAKALTAYVFYGIFGLVLLWRHPNRLFLLHPYSIALHVAAAAFPFVWSELSNDAVLSGMLWQLLFHAAHVDDANIVSYLKLFAIYPFKTIICFLPVSALALYCVVLRRFGWRSLREPPVDIAAWALALNLLPYWFSPSGSPRYILPMYPLVALLMAFVVLRSGKAMTGLAARALVATVAVAYVASLVGFPLYERIMRGSYADAAETVLARVGDQPLYATDFTSVGLSIVANLNARRAPKPAITTPPKDFSTGYVLSHDPDTSVGKVDLAFGVGRNVDGGRTRYLLCRGPACPP